MILLKMFLIRLMLYVALFPYLLMLTSYVMGGVFYVYGIYNFHKTYIQVIDTPSYPDTIEILEEFNNLGEGKIVRFTEIEDGRPLIIEEMQDTDSMLIPDAVGIAFPKFKKCNIKIKKGLTKESYREVLIHEYLHCYGYDHVSSVTDLMYFSLTPEDKNASIREYAKKVRETFYD